MQNIKRVSVLPKKIMKFLKYFTKYFMKYFTPKIFMKFYITTGKSIGKVRPLAIFGLKVAPRRLNVWLTQIRVEKRN